MKSVLRLLSAFAAILGMVASSTAAQGISLRKDGKLRICGDFEYVRMNGEIISRQIIQNCKFRDKTGRTMDLPLEFSEPRDVIKKVTDSSSDSGISVGGLALVGIAVVAVAAGGEGSGGNVGPHLIDRRSPLPFPGNPTDPDSWRTEEFNNQHGLGVIGVEHRYAAGATGQNTLGAIFDSGIDLGHNDVGGIRLDLSHNFSGDSNDLSDPLGHGTHVYGIAGATRNGTDIHGVAPDAEFMFLKDRGDDLLGVAEDALRRVTNAGVDAMNNSWGLFIPIDFFTPQEWFMSLTSNAVVQLRRSAQAGVSVIFATGNDGLANVDVMAGLPVVLPELEDNWIAVTALGNTDDLRSARIANYANRCGSAMNWCLAAPGTNINSLRIGGGTIENTGTSMAAPHVTGAVLVLKSQFPEMTTREVHQILFDTAVDLGAPGVDPVYGHGALNLNEAMSPQGALMVELGPQIDQTTVPLSESWIVESAVTGGTLAAAMFDQRVLVTDNYDRGYFANLGPRIATDAFSVSPDMRAGLAAAFSLTRDPHHDLQGTGYDLRLDAFGPDHDVTRIAHVDPVMALVSETTETGFSMRAPIGKATLSMASATATDGSVFSLGAGLPLGDDHTIAVSFGRAQETDSLLGAKTHGAFAGLNSDTIYGRVQADIALGERVTLNGSVTAGQTSFEGNGLIAAGRADAQAVALGLTVTDALARGDKLSLALARPFSVSGGQMTLRSGTGISSAVANRRTNRVELADTTLSLGASKRTPELHLGYLHGFDAKGWNRANLAFGGIARLDGGARVAAAQIALTLGF